VWELVDYWNGKGKEWKSGDVVWVQWPTYNKRQQRAFVGVLDRGDAQAWAVFMKTTVENISWVPGGPARDADKPYLVVGTNELVVLFLLFLVCVYALPVTSLDNCR
jgi:hypothetical protein